MYVYNLLTDLHRLHSVFYKLIWHKQQIIWLQVQVGVDILPQQTCMYYTYSGLHVIPSAEWSKPHRHWLVRIYIYIYACTQKGQTFSRSQQRHIIYRYNTYKVQFASYNNNFGTHIITIYIHIILYAILWAIYIQYKCIMYENFSHKACKIKICNDTVMHIIIHTYHKCSHCASTDLNQEQTTALEKMNSKQ